MTITAGAGATERQSDWTIESVIEDYIADNKLSRRKLAFLEQTYDRALASLRDAWSVDIARREYCEEMELPQGSYWCQVMAAALDFMSPRRHEDGGSRLTEMSRELMLNGFLEPEDFEALDR